jgi:hypothetical protein
MTGKAAAEGLSSHSTRLVPVLLDPKSAANRENDDSHQFDY